MSIVLAIFNIAAPLLLITMGALISEYAGRLAMFLEHIINLGAFFCYAFTLATGNLALGMALSVTVCVMIVTLLEKTASRFNANMFLISLAMNLLFASCVTFFSVLAFKTRGVLSSHLIDYSASKMKIITSLLCYLFVILQLFLVRRTGTGLILRVTGSNADVLAARGINVDRYRTLSWILAAACGAFAGCVFTARLSSFVPGVSSGRGWTALAAVFLGRKNNLAIIPAVLLFALSEYASSAIQNLPLFAKVPSSFLLALPYILSLGLIIVIPQRKK